MMKPLVLAVLAVPFLAVTLDGQAEPRTEVERLRQLAAIEDAKTAVAELRGLATSITTKKRLKCMMAVGTEPFCDCLAQNTPVGASFEDYITITTTSKDDLKYSTLDQETKGLVDNTLKAREACVVKAFRRP
jgi:hypothetical protein